MKNGLKTTLKLFVLVGHLYAHEQIFGDSEEARLRRSTTQFDFWIPRLNKWR